MAQYVYTMNRVGKVVPPKREILKNISLSFFPGAKIGVLGLNGSGKSTLLRIMAGIDQDYNGEARPMPDIKVGYLPQEPQLDESKDVRGNVEEGLREALDALAGLEQVYNDYAEADADFDDLAKKQGRFEDIIQVWDAHNLENKLEQAADSLRLPPWDADVSKLSGGEKRRVALCRLLLSKPDMLLLDEPTNHLDIDSILWLESFLQTYPGAVVIVSHDKMFLDNVTNRTIEISLGRIYDYPKPYTQFLTLRAELREQQEATFKNQRKEIERTEKLIQKFKAKASKATMAQSLVKKLDRMDVVEIEQTDNAAMNINFAQSIQPGKIVLEVDQVSKSYGNKSVLDKVDLSLERGKRVAFVGQNGMGKSTLAKIIVGDVAAQGHVNLGHNVQLGYFAQNQAEYLDGEKTVLDIMLDAATDNNRVKVRDMLGSFLFRGEDAEKKVQVLSGGERNRLA